jgi:hypothetical protein
MAAPSGRCPACDRFIGPIETCPYCDCPSERQAGLRILRLLAVLLAVGGLALLAYASHIKDTPALQIDAIRPSMNFARIRVTGSMAVPPRSGLARSGDPWCGFTLDDGTGRIRVTAYGRAASALADTFEKTGTETGRLFNVEGWLTVRADQAPALLVRDPGQVTVCPKEKAR